MSRSAFLDKLDKSDFDIVDIIQNSSEYSSIFLAFFSERMRGCRDTVKHINPRCMIFREKSVFFLVQNLPKNQQSIKFLNVSLTS